MKQINVCFQEGYTAGGKAKVDIHDILMNRGIESVDCRCINSERVVVKIFNEIYKALLLFSLMIRKERVYVVQHPLSHLRIINNILTCIGRRKKLIIIVHDLDGCNGKNVHNFATL